MQHAQKSALIVLVVFAIWAAGGFATVWPVVVMAVVGLKLAAHARRVYGGDAGRYDRDAEDDVEPEFTIV